MDVLSLNGEWQLKEEVGEKEYKANVPTCNFLDLQAAGAIPDPHLSINEDKVQWLGNKNWIYSKVFSISKDFINHEHVDLICEMLDTYCDIFVNSKFVASCCNINRTYRINIKDVLKEENLLEIKFYSPLPLIEEKQKENPLPNSTMGEAGSCHIRKSPYHFGWDWGPHLLCCGINRDIYVEAYDEKIVDFKIEQEHSQNNVLVKMNVTVDLKDSVDVSYTYTIQREGDPEVCKLNTVLSNAIIGIDNPHLWTCNGMGEQPLYKVKCEVMRGENVIDSIERTIGLRKIELDNSEDKYGKNFCFKINGKRIFARGANWIASDSFVNRTSHEKLYDLLKKAKDCNMNMLRVWGGAYYESNDFYDICDRLGILVWQDCNFACSPYPFNDKDFVLNVLEEIKDNVTRLRHHACLCLWAGNNEIESMSMAWLYRRDVINFTGEFFYKTLLEAIRKYDSQTPYIACTPSGGEYMKNVNSDKYYDTHLWHVWHGLRPLEYYRKRNTRFCSEFGIESFPSLNALDIFAKDDELTSIDSPVMKAHQKCIGGNEKMLYYVLSKYWTPKNFMDLVYLSQLTQAQCVQNATEGWRIKKDCCNGSLYWQYNDCWGVCSWSGMDYYGNMKALQYAAKRFNQPLTVVIQGYRDRVELFALNDSPCNENVSIEYGIKSFDGKELYKEKKDIYLASDSSQRLDVIKHFAIKCGKKKQVYAYIKMYKAGKEIATRSLPFVNENKAKFINPKLEYSLEKKENDVTIKLKASNFARYVELRIKGETNAFSDNYFDMEKGDNKEVTIKLSEDMTLDELKDKLTVRSLFDIENKNSRLKDKMIKIKIFLMPVNFANYIARTFDV